MTPRTSSARTLKTRSLMTLSNYPRKPSQHTSWEAGRRACMLLEDCPSHYSSRRPCVSKKNDGVPVPSSTSLKLQKHRPSFSAWRFPLVSKDDGLSSLVASSDDTKRGCTVLG